MVERVASIVGARPAAWRGMQHGHTEAHTFVFALPNGESVFVKQATDAQTAVWLRRERSVYETVQAEFLPHLIGWDEDGLPLLVVEDVSGGHIAPPWSGETIERVRSVLDELAATGMPDGFPALEQYPRPLKRWNEIAEDREAFLKLGLVNADWFDRALPELIAAEAGAALAGNALVHSDVRSDNICFYGKRTVLVDWSWACRGNAKFDLVSWLPSLHAEGGPVPWNILVDEPELIAMQAGYLAHRVIQPGEQDPAIRELQLAQLRSALPWATKALGVDAELV
jgi:hypothetical protein